ncbi:unnamed protein product [Rotaria sordida]|uniref:Death domain-containing protein n=1 Tax=Rotaria sordida TaxID=392033 RepID=A0A819ATL6_9BILA|nr:unnamed protein product [Rotaria sordida]
MAITMLDKPLGDLRREIADLRQLNISHDYDINKLGTIITVSKNSLRETENYQQQLLQQLQQFEVSLADINQILRANMKQKAQLEQQQEQESGIEPLYIYIFIYLCEYHKFKDTDIELHAKLMALNAEALECRAAAVQLQQQAKMALIKAAEIEKRANDELAQQAREMKLKQQEIERDRAAELERRVRLEEERQRLNELQQQQKERLLATTKIQQQEQDEYANWKERDFMNNDQYPQCIFRLAPDTLSMPIDVIFLKVSETENLLDNQEELISTPLEVKFDSTAYQQQTILISIPYIIKRSTHRENIIKIRQSNGIWMPTDTKESIFDAYKEKRFVECKLNQSVSCAVVSRLKRDTILINKQSSGRFLSDADHRLTIQWPKNVCSTDFHINLRVLPVDLPTFTQFSKNFSNECQGLLAVGPIIELHYDDITLLKPIQFTLPILVQTKKKVKSTKPTTVESQASQQTTTNQPSQQEIILQQQQAIFKSLLGEDLSNERLVLLYSSHNENIWHIDKNVNLIDSKSHDIITTNMQYLHSRMIIARYDKQFISTKQLQTTINLLEQSLNQRTVSLILRRRLSNPNEICFVCCSNQRINTIDNDLEQENFIDNEQQSKELTLQEGQLLQLRFRGNVLPIEYNQQSYPFAFNTYFPFYFQTNVYEIDKYSQHLSPFYYGFVQIFTKGKISKPITKDLEKKKQQLDIVKQDWYETDICIAELVIRLPKPREGIRVPTPKTSTTFTSEGILTPILFHEISASLYDDEWRRLARRLGMTRIRIEAIEHEYQDEAPYYMLLTWFKRAPRSVDKDLLLIHGLMNINRWDIAQELQSMKEAKSQEQITSSKDDQLRILSVPFNRICQHDECVRMWKLIARELTLTNEDIQRIEEQYSSKQEQCLRSLEQWALNNSQADIKSLSRIIRSLGFKSLSRELDNMA